MKQYWNDAITGKSYRALQQLARKYKFVLIGGWAAYLYAKAQKSRDIDIVVDFGQLRTLDADFPVAKNERLKKYEIRMDGFDVDVYLPKFSRLSVAPETLLKSGTVIEGIKVAELDYLVLLKLGAFRDRKGSVKGEKDQIDIVNLLYHCEIDSKRLAEAGRKNAMGSVLADLQGIVRDFPHQSLGYIGADFNPWKKWRRNFLAREMV